MCPADISLRYIDKICAGAPRRKRMDHVAADQRIGILDQLKQPRPHPVVVGPDVAGAQVLAREMGGGDDLREASPWVAGE